MEVNGMTGIYADFGAWNNNFDSGNESGYYRHLSQIIIAKLRDNDAVASASFYRRAYNYDAVFNKYYGPIMAESALWG